MVEITLTDEQVKMLAEATSPVVLRDAQGNVVGRARSEQAGETSSCGFTSEEVERAKQLVHSEGPWYTTDEVLQRLRSGER